MREGNKHLLRTYGNDLDLCSKVLAGEAEPTKEAFFSLSKLMTELLGQLEAALAKANRVDRKVAEAERKATKQARKAARRARVH